MKSVRQAESAESPAPSRQKRSRAGCLTCRTRRRKCDEGRPRCQNCIAKGFECHYAAAYQILGKNNFTPEVPSGVKYTSLRFVSDGEKQASHGQSHGGAKLEDAQLVTSPIDSLDSATKQIASGGEDDNARITQQSISPSIERYEFALHGLLALGTGGAGVVEPQDAIAPSTLLADERNTPNDQNGSRKPQVESSFENLPHDSSVQTWSLMDVANTGGILDTPGPLALELFRHYRYVIAPWLDICDTNQTFGCEVMQLSTISTSIRCALLAVAQASLNGPGRLQTEDPDLAALAQLRRQDEVGEDKVQDALLDAISIVRDVVVDLSRLWLQKKYYDLAQVALDVSLPEVGNGPLAASVFWLVARIQLSVALMNTSSIKVSVPAYPANWDDIAAGTADYVFRHTHHVVALCIEATIFSRGDEDRWLQRRYALNRVELWKALVSRFEQWYKLRPQDFHPVIELYPKDGRSSEDEFPTIVFSSGATTLANQLYHTGMLQLLQNKPRFVDRAFSNSSSMSLLWHTHRICGTAVNNDRWDCWDPSLMASLFIAAKTATHHSQHRVILSALENTQRLTRWNISHHIEQLRLEWQQAEGW